MVLNSVYNKRSDTVALFVICEPCADMAAEAYKERRDGESTYRGCDHLGAGSKGFDIFRCTATLMYFEANAHRPCLVCKRSIGSPGDGCPLLGSR